MLSASKNRILLIAYTAALALLGITGFVFALSGDEVMNGYVLAYLLGLFVFQWVANFLAIRDDNR
jgi:hypothetical protein